jgi:hypothetical protein
MIIELKLKIDYINWDKDVVKSVRIRYKQLTNDETIKSHFNRW